MDRSRIVLVDLPHMLREIIERAVEDEPDMNVVGGRGAARELRSLVEETDADFVISGREHDLPSVGALLRERPSLRVLTVTGEGREASLFELRPTRTPLGEVSPAAIVAAIRNVPSATT